VVGGPFYSAAGRLQPSEKTEKERERVISGLQEVGDYVEERGIFVTIEPLNRFEIYFLNQISQCKQLVKKIGHPRIEIWLLKHSPPGMRG